MCSKRTENGKKTEKRSKFEAVKNFNVWSFKTKIVIYKPTFWACSNAELQLLWTLLSKLFRSTLCKCICASPSARQLRLPGSCACRTSPEGTQWKWCWAEITADTLPLMEKFGGLELCFFMFFTPVHFWCRSMQSLLVLRLLNSPFQGFSISGLQKY